MRSSDEMIDRVGSWGLVGFSLAIDNPERAGVGAARIGIYKPSQAKRPRLADDDETGGARAGRARTAS